MKYWIFGFFGQLRCSHESTLYFYFNQLKNFVNFDILQKNVRIFEEKLFFEKVETFLPSPGHLEQNLVTFDRWSLVYLFRTLINTTK